MKQRFYFIFISFFLVILLVPLSQAAQPTVSYPTAAIGIQIEHPIADVIAANTTHKFHFHLFNVTDGKPFLWNGSNIVCVFHLYNPDGSHLLKVNNVSGDDIYDWEQIVMDNNFSTVGQYSYVFQCNNSQIGGFYEHDFMVTATGTKEGNTTSIFLILALASVILLLFAYLFKNNIFAFIAGLSFSITGVYTMINGFGNLTSMFTQGISLIILGLGLILTITSAVDLIKENSGEDEEVSLGDDDE